MGRSTAGRARHPVVLRVVHGVDALRLKRAVFFLRKLQLPIRPTDRVVDVGSGGDPHPRADVIVDRSVDTGSHRTTGFRRSAPAVIADIHRLPFKDHAFDFSVCAHVLEHVEDPIAAAAELSRISRRGYVETPSALHEKLFPIGWHKWMVTFIDGGLRFEAKETPYLDQFLGSFFSSRWGIDRTLMKFVWNHTDELFVQHVWIGRLNVRVTGKVREFFSPEEQDALESMGDAEPSSRTKRFIYDVGSRLRYPRSHSGLCSQSAAR